MTLQSSDRKSIWFEPFSSRPPPVNFINPQNRKRVHLRSQLSITARATLFQRAAPVWWIERTGVLKDNDRDSCVEPPNLPSSDVVWLSFEPRGVFIFSTEERHRAPSHIWIVTCTRVTWIVILVNRSIRFSWPISWQKDYSACRRKLAPKAGKTATVASVRRAAYISIVDSTTHANVYHMGKTGRGSTPDHPPPTLSVATRVFQCPYQRSLRRRRRNQAATKRWHRGRRHRYS